MASVSDVKERNIFREEKGLSLHIDYLKGHGPVYPGEGYPSKRPLAGVTLTRVTQRVILAVAYFFVFHTTCLQGRYGYPSARITLPEC